jgi:osmotically-inducible protein OsmY
MTEGYTAQHLWEALARDPRVAELGISVTADPGRVYLSGEVATEERRHLIATVAGELLPDHEVRNQVTVTACREPEDVENLP